MSCENYLLEVEDILDEAKDSLMPDEMDELIDGIQELLADVEEYRYPSEET